MKVLIVGAGIAGAALAVALGRRGLCPTLIERRSALADVGAGVVLGPNVMAALGPLGLDAAVRAVGQPVAAFSLRDARGRLLQRTAYAAPGLPPFGVGLHRAALHATLRAALPSPARLGCTLVGLRPLPGPQGGVEATLSDGEQARFDLVVAADGLRSAMRDALNPSFTLRYSGTTCWRVVLPGRVEGLPDDEAVELWGRGRRLGAVPLGGDQTYVFMTETAPPRSPTPFTTLEGLRARFAELPEPAGALLARVPSVDALLHNDLEDGVAQRWWAPGQVLIGDAAHAVTPNMGQGAGLAIEDAACLAAILAEDGPTDAALAKFQALRQPRARWICQQSATLGRVGALRSAPLRALRDLALRCTPPAIAAASLRRVLLDMPGVPLRGALSPPSV